MLVLSRKPGERILVKPDERAGKLLTLLQSINFNGEVLEVITAARETLAEALPLAEQLAVESIAITSLKITGARVKLGIDAATERAVVREEIARELRVPA